MLGIYFSKVSRLSHFFIPSLNHCKTATAAIKCPLLYDCRILHQVFINPKCINLSLATRAGNKANQVINHATKQTFYGAFYSKKVAHKSVPHLSLGDCASERPLAFHLNEILISKVLHKFMLAWLGELTCLACRYFCLACSPPPHFPLLQRMLGWQHSVL